MKHVVIAAFLACLALPRAQAQTPVENLAVTVDGLDAELTWTGVPGDTDRLPPYEAGYLSEPFTVFADAIPMNVDVDAVDPTLYRARVKLPDWNVTYTFGVYTIPGHVLYTIEGTSGTPPDQIPPSAATLTVTSSSGSVIVAWTAPGDDGMAGRAQSYDLRYSAAGPLGAGNWDDGGTIILTGLPLPGASGQAETLALDGLDAGATYHFALKTADEVPNWSSLSASVAVTVVADTVAPAAFALDVAAAVDEAVTLTWVAPGDDGMLGMAAAYDLRFSTGAINGDADFAMATPVAGEPTPAPAGTSQGVRVGGLAPRTTYTFAIRATDEAGHASALATVSVQTLQAMGSSGATQACSAGVPVRIPLPAAILAIVAAALLIARR